jgi:hypothetical protein
LDGSQVVAGIRLTVCENDTGAMQRVLLFWVPPVRAGMIHDRRMRHSISEVLSNSTLGHSTAAAGSNTRLAGLATGFRSGLKLDPS